MKLDQNGWLLKKMVADRVIAHGNVYFLSQIPLRGACGKSTKPTLRTT